VGAREVSVDGQVVRRSDRRVPSGWVGAAVDDGLVLQRRRSVVVWDPDTGRVSEQAGVDGLLATYGNRIRACALGTGCRRSVILDLDSGARVDVAQLPHGRLEGYGKFSPDGTLIASPVFEKRRFTGVALVDTRDGSARPIPGAPATGRGFPELAWSPSSGWLFFRGPDRSVMAYLPGEPRAVRLPFRLPRDAVHLLAG
jgi:hypothetical protein